MEYLAFHGVTKAQHQAQFDNADGLSKKGFHLTSLSIYREANNDSTFYASVWLKNDNPPSEWVACHGLTSEQYQVFFNEWVSKGFHPVIITATGGGTIGINNRNTALFAAVFEKGSVAFEARHDIDKNTFNTTCNWAKANGYYLRWATLYGGRDRLYAGIWEKMPVPFNWDQHFVTGIDSRIEVPAISNNLTIDFLTASPFGEYLAVYTDRVQDVKTFNGIEGVTYQTLFNNLTGNGYFPKCVNVGGDSRTVPGLNFSGLFYKAALTSKKIISSGIRIKSVVRKIK
jgi:hypothetical protein